MISPLLLNRRALFFQAIRGPIILIVIGTLFVLQQSNMAPVSRTWPLILIVIGILRLLERVGTPPPAYLPPQPPPGVYPR